MRFPSTIAALAAAAALLGAALVHADGAADLVGASLPSVRVRPVAADAEGGDLSVEAHRGQVVLVGFFATWCGSCERIRPFLEQLADQHGDRGLTVLLYSHQPRAQLRRYLADNPTTLPVAQCTGRTAVTYGASSVPTLVVADREGVVRHVFQSGADEVRPALRGAVEALLR